MNKLRVVLSLFVVVGASLWALRHHSLRQLQAEQLQFQQQSEEVSNLQAMVTLARETSATVTNAGLSATERSELLRLRGEIGGLRQELAQATNQLAKIARAPRAVSSGAPAEPGPSREEITAKMSLGRQWMITLIIYAEEHDHQLPATLTEAAQAPGEALQGVDMYEFMQSGLDLRSVTSPSRLVVLREKQPWKNSRGRWQRGYAFADGHVELASSDTPDFSEWEEKLKAPVDQPSTP